ncbi:AAA family ATPase [Selenihalanaerobacter shriftii]|uniref:PD-(D/E)XK nuclease superfamily protein n=1 Tax=Selenihalanaerobacter shriftii TaxID=142842 RepID=A0A1T4NDT7_9FIRM|nr:AAA family ATPase [Selenihalanaerobacter shriftii]SJZ77384.1 PD-(D/E)XK nuclease superfamily protein [Selenihalanaerobacter shriftii]
MKKLPIGIDDFKKIKEEGYYYVDKSLFIKEIIDESAEVILLARPRRFGKTLNLSMLHYFFEKRIKDGDNIDLFQGLKIKDAEQRYLEKQNKYPIIHLDFKDVKANNWSNCFANLKRIIAKEYKRHSYLLDAGLLLEYEEKEYREIMDLSANLNAYQFSLKNLSEHLSQYHQQKVMILIDEYDQAIKSGYMNGFYEEVVGFMRSLLSGGLKSNPNLAKGVLTGILRVAKESIFSGLNNLVVNTLLDKEYDKYFGLLELEVKDILDYYNLNYKSNEVKEWYNGYSFGENIVYNPWSIMTCIRKEGELKPYWINTSGNELIRKLVIEGDSEVKGDLELLIQGKTVKKKIDENIVFGDIDKKGSSLWSFLLLSGYLRAKNKYMEEARLYCDLDIPNKEVKYIYEEIILNWFEDKITSQNLKLMLKSLTTGDIETFTVVFKEFVINSMSSFDVGGDEPEKVYHAFVLGLLLNLRDRYKVKSNRESGYGRYDVMIIPENKSKLGIVIEFKKLNQHQNEDLETAVNAALKQIEERNYAQELLSQGVTGVLEIGMAFSGKQVKVKSKNINK